MIQLLTKLNILDNTGAIQARCIKTYKSKYAHTGDVILVSILKTFPWSKIKKADIYKALIVRTKSTNSLTTRWSDNSIILLSSKDLSPLGSRIKGGISKDLTYKKGTLKYLSLAKIIL